jgi:4-diphosphocytidyl-2-C-methyl-D-erythritol kinase
LCSPAKVNLYLRIVGKRPDGYHELETVMVPLDFGDQITFQPCASGITLACDDPRLPTDDTNLALRAAKRLAERFGVKRGAKITLRKRTPLAAGLGGGSSNAATVLLGLNRLWDVNAPLDKLAPLAASMGSDINFFLATSAALCHGRGEQVTPIPCKLSAAILLVNPGFGISTKWAYESLPRQSRDRAKATTESGLTVEAPAVSLLTRALAEDDLAGVGRALFNSLETPSIGKFPVLELIKNTMRACGAAGALMSGSGATVFGLFAETKDAARAAEKVRAEFGPSMWTQVAKATG